MAGISPNILITGTPGVGKSSIASKVCKLTGLKNLNISRFAINKNLLSEHDSERDCEVIDDEKVVSKMKKLIKKGGLLVDYHSCDFFPAHWFDKVFVLRTDNCELHSRLTERGYSSNKITENIECEIFQVTLEEAIETFGQELVIEMENNNKNQLKKNIKAIVDIVKSLQTRLIDNTD